MKSARNLPGHRCYRLYDVREFGRRNECLRSPRSAAERQQQVWINVNYDRALKARTDMPSTHASLHYHLVFSTKDRRPMIVKEWRSQLHAYLGGIVKGLGGMPLAIGGVEDHVHLLVGLKTSHRLDYFTRDLKADSAEWVHRKLRKTLFAWQKGYGVFSVSPSNVDGVRQYVLRQESHHQAKSFAEEYLDLLGSSGIKYDTRYVW